MNSKQKAAIVVSSEDNVATAIIELKAGNSIIVMADEEKRQIRLKNDIKFLHKFALEDIDKGQHIIKYGQPIGEATTHIQRGEHVHIHNIRSLREFASE